MLTFLRCDCQAKLVRPQCLEGLEVQIFTVQPSASIFFSLTPERRHEWKPKNLKLFQNNGFFLFHLCQFKVLKKKKKCWFCCF